MAEVCGVATLRIPVVYEMYSPREHTEHLEPILAEMQSVAREHPDATW
jgi:ring-1,2-phenylacetyl-CoA epoxidase subunit PaaC